MKAALIAASLCLALLPSSGFADESSFLNPLTGTWSGRGTVVLKIGSSPIRVSCTLPAKSQGLSLSMSGRCRGLLVVQRAISANIRSKGARYTGSYTGPSGQPSSLSGAREGNVIRLAVRWARVINGDRVAQLTIQKVGSRGLRLTTTDKDPKTGRNVVTSDIHLIRG